MKNLFVLFLSVTVCSAVSQARITQADRNTFSIAQSQLVEQAAEEDVRERVANRYGSTIASQLIEFEIQFIQNEAWSTSVGIDEKGFRIVCRTGGVYLDKTNNLWRSECVKRK